MSASFAPFGYSSGASAAFFVPFDESSEMIKHGSFSGAPPPKMKAKPRLLRAGDRYVDI